MFPRRAHRPLTAVAAVVAAAALAAPASAADGASVVERSAKPLAGKNVVTFSLHGVRPRNIVSAALVSGGKRRRVAVSAARRGARRGVLRLRTVRRSGRQRLQLRVDRRAPATRIVDRLRDDSGRRAQLRFRASEKGSTFLCSLDARPWRRCSSPTTYSGLSDGRHTFRVRAKDRRGNVDPKPATSTWTVGETTATATTTAPVTAATRTAPQTAPAVSVPGPQGGAATEGAGFAPLSDADAAARVQRSVFEPRPQNGSANATVPSPAQLATYYAARAGQEMCSTKLDLKVTGNFTGTTDEIIQWGAWKWGLDAEVMRALATQESYWRQDAVGDAGESYGLTQVKRTNHAGTFPLSRDSTAFAVDYVGAMLRYYLNGCGDWLNEMERGQPYAAGDLWGSLGAWFSGRWHTAPAEDYIAKVKDHLASRTWTKSGF